METTANIIIGAVGAALVLLIREIGIYFKGYKEIKQKELDANLKREQTDTRRAVELYEKYATKVEDRLTKIHEDMEKLMAEHQRCQSENLSLRIRIEFLEKKSGIDTSSSSFEHEALRLSDQPTNNNKK